MSNKTWTSDKGLVQNGWHFFSLVSAKNLSPEFRDRQLDRFLGTIIIESKYGESSGQKNYEMYVRAYPEIPVDQIPGGGFTQVGCREPNEPVDNNYLNNLKQVFRQVTGKNVTSVLVLPGPYYAPSSVVKGQFEKVSGYDKIVWVR